MSDLTQNKQPQPKAEPMKHEVPTIHYKDFKKEANIDPELKADAEGHDLKDDIKPDMQQGMKD